MVQIIDPEPGVDMPFATNQNTKIYYRVEGEGEPLVMIIGLGGNGDAWGCQCGVMSRDYQCILIDNRGAGRSDMPDEPYSMALFAQDVAAVLDDLGIESAHIMGASMGGLIAQEFYHLYSARVRSLILVCTGVGASDPKYVWPTQHVIEVLTEGPPEDNDPKLLERYFSIFYDKAFMDKTPNLIESIIEKRKTMQQPAYANKRQLEALMSHTPNSPRLKNINVSTLVIHGVHDQIWPLVNAHYLHEHIAHAELIVMPDAAHMLFIEQADAFNDHILEFLQALPSKTS